MQLDRSSSTRCDIVRPSRHTNFPRLKVVAVVDAEVVTEVVTVDDMELLCVELPDVLALADADVDAEEDLDEVAVVVRVDDILVLTLDDAEELALDVSVLVAVDDLVEEALLVADELPVFDGVENAVVDALELGVLL